MSEPILIETGSTGRVAYARIGPNEDLVLGIEKICLARGFKNAFVRGAVGSLTDACLGTPDGKYLHVTGPAVELTNLTGEVRATDDGAVRAVLSGVVADTDGEVYGGPFIAGANPVCVTLEVTLEEWLPTG
ncbi:DNA-binding protein [Sulfitobacter sp. EhC04]|uniref:PPC domain-containing DNA-binding protein n=1 Tax=Sulfitobacter sp. EhC04 TaxID=1849168 RepID=UPI0007F45B1D|nr:PPC domain-containing DNA-binding protein [Sulfitobacter sp. EhC04]OAN76002.1 DNA-binding protein [Sulfitobacter sp. EhC04]